ncbi:MAG TPA: DCC1-like thiol-disulfide oxidoreductase family protein, partial [Isosphaeraceae bacterium]|nr:DCC1-like thiol-disulfide oxidoreductase family protein [Isosphaeraceae bacterium]
MEPDPVERVENPPERPLLVFDGDCGFCKQWVHRWQAMTGDRVDYRPSQEVAPKYPQIGPDRFRESVWLIEPDGHAWHGAQAVFRLYSLVGEKRWLAHLYRATPAFAAISDYLYSLITQHREAVAVVVRWLWGDVTIRPSYVRMRAILLRGMGLIYLVAFGSLAVQIDGLIGSQGILPLADFLHRAHQALGDSARTALPTLLWLDASDRALHVLCWGGVALGALLAAGVMPGACVVLLWLFYLSLSVAGQEFLNYQWDGLLLETGLLA